MLDAETKARIDSARDILVGKVPDPKSQVEQITIALIYKFMDDMDRQSEEFGGKATFFTGQFKKYRWANLLDRRLGGHERLLLYAEGIEKMNSNKNIPQLFRDIFRGVFLPYRDPETLSLFLKDINGFMYDHSERLGDAYEYLLSVLGTQGEAGQFRTPRHIIDFIVSVVDPQKHETVLDPACGTAGFLISAYKHILNASAPRKTARTKRGQESRANVELDLTPDELARLMTNFRGYDIAPDMVRLSRVNMYLHGFANPVIHEYDTLTSEERWDERCDVIMANPPFMSPKGGIRPHNRFSIKARRSEVLFIDYIAEHLNPGGRAGVIVPEGIIFQSQNAYKKLRRMLVENYLWAVVSLPAGVFNPYSGVKTSILFFDCSLAKRTDEVVFAKVENDGFDLGAQRRQIAKNDLPAVLNALLEQRQGGVAPSELGATSHLLVTRKRLLESPDYNLSADRYRDTGPRVSGNWPMVKLGEVCEIYQPKTITSKEIRNSGPYKVFGANGVIGYYDQYNHENAEIAVTCRGATCGTVNLTESKSWITGNAMVIRPKNPNLHQRYVYFILQNTSLTSAISGTAQPQITRRSLAPFQIPLPPLDVQETIVAELDGYRKVIDGARQVITNYKPVIKIDPQWPGVEMDAVSEINAKLVDPKLPKYACLPHVSAENMESGNGKLLQVRSAEEDKMTSGKYLFEPGCVLYSKLRPYLQKAAVASFRGLCSADMYPIRTKPDLIEPEFLLWILLSDEFTAYANGMSCRARMPKLNRAQLLSYVLPLPSLEVQRQIVAQLKVEQVMVDGNRKLIEVSKAKIGARLKEIWGEDA